MTGDRGAPSVQSSGATEPADAGDAESEKPSLPPLELREPLPAVIATTADLTSYLARLQAGSGPVALDAERASGYRYSQRAYLVQVRRAGAGSALIDPIAFDDLSALGEAIGDAEWILHAATQDLPCLADIGMRPHTLFDTELAGRLLNLPRVGLATLVETLLGRHLAKEYSAADWSTRPLPDPWLKYAALDVEVLIELRDEMERRLLEADKLDWAREEFTALLDFTGPARRKEPWRRTSGIHKVRGRRTLAVVRSLWETRDRIAADRDITPGRIISDSSILEIAQSPPDGMAALKETRAMRGRGPRRFISQWHDAVKTALALPDDELPGPKPRHDGPPPPRAWADKNPDAAARLGAARETTRQIAETHNLPVENLLNPSLLRHISWEPPSPLDGATLRAVLVDLGARPWQVALTIDALLTALATTAIPPENDG